MQQQQTAASRPRSVDVNRAAATRGRAAGGSARDRIRDDNTASARSRRHDDGEQQRGEWQRWRDGGAGSGAVTTIARL
ncbi:hypothetical protein Syun_005111 [Stephania yunnanensis]|uniref:Uncharacterized protein n=1 Tax=Stephania yunnanensis TaxID=152371 RepID=A0AAP0L7U1_9MAGN